MIFKSVLLVTFNTWLYRFLISLYLTHIYSGKKHDMILEVFFIYSQNPQVIEKSSRLKIIINCIFIADLYTFLHENSENEKFKYIFLERLSSCG